MFLLIYWQSGRYFGSFRFGRSRFREVHALIFSRCAELAGISVSILFHSLLSLRPVVRGGRSKTSSDGGKMYFCILPKPFFSVAACPYLCKVFYQFVLRINDATVCVSPVKLALLCTLVTKMVQSPLLTQWRCSKAWNLYLKKKYCVAVQFDGFQCVC